jgi:hypothetical protein
MGAHGNLWKIEIKHELSLSYMIRLSLSGLLSLGSESEDNIMDDERFGKTLDDSCKSKRQHTEDEQRLNMCLIR